MSKRVLVGLAMLGLTILTGVILVAVYVPGENVTRVLVVLGFLLTLGKTGYDVWEKERERKKKHAAANSPIEFKVHEVFFRFKGQDSAGGECSTTKASALYVSYWFKLDAFNSRAENLGLCDVMLHFAKGGKVVHEQVPSAYTGEIVHGRRHCIDVTAVTLPSRDWVSITFQGGVRQTVLAAIADCDEIYLTAKSTTGEPFRVPLATSIIENG